MLKELELYIHIPFCVKKCAYCDFLSFPAAKPEQEAYVQAVVEEILSYKETAEAYIVTSVFFGGGTPSILEADLVVQIFQALKSVFKIKEAAEITMEVNPGTVTEHKLSTYAMLGVNRISIGLQSTSNEELKLLGRIHSYETFLETYQLTRRLLFMNINVDLISAIPGQTCESWKETLTAVAELGPEHISAYSLIIEEDTPYFELYGNRGQDGSNGNGVKVVPLPSEEAERQMYEDTRKILMTYGYSRYEISNYAKPGYECNHNIGYWKRKEYLGFGIGAASLLGNKRFANVKNIKTYIDMYHQKNGGIVHENEEVLTTKEIREETVFLGLRMMDGIEVTEELNDNYSIIIGKFVKEGYLEIKDRRLRLTENGISVSNYILSEFL